MLKDIKYKGYTQVPNDYEVPDGELDCAVGLVPEGGAIKPIMPAQALLTLSGGEVVMYVHDPSFTHYICRAGDTGYYFWIDKDDSTHVHNTLKSFGTSTTVYQISAVGNTLVFLTDTGTYYFLWKNSSTGGSYLDLGMHIPELPLSFGLQGKIVKTDTFNVDFDDIPEDDIFTKEFTDDNKRKISDQVLAKVNKFILEESIEKGRFLFPFFVRYAYRLYDGSLTMHSAPVLMVASSDLAPQVAWKHLGGSSGNYRYAELFVMGMLHRLDFAVVQQSYLTALNNWSDIVSSVDVFISKPIYTYDQSGECTRFSQRTDGDSYSICRMMGGEGTGAKPVGTLPYQKYDMSDMYALAFSQDSTPRWQAPDGRLMIPQKTLESVKEDIRNCAQFYFLKSFKLNELSVSRSIIDIPENYLQSLVVREQMTDDYDSHDQLIANYAYNFNGRINLANITKQLFEGFHAGSLFPYTHNRITSYNAAGSEQDVTITEQSVNVECFVSIKQDGREILVDGGTFYYNDDMKFLYFYYPNTKAYKAYIQQQQGSSSYSVIEIPLEAHAMLNGAFYFGGWDPSLVYETTIPAETLDKTVSMPNKIYTSEINNPFYFPLLGINTVGTGEIRGICAAARALSQGQFGQFPLYAFTTEGVWALETTSTGTYSAKQPITRDVCISSDSISQLDSSVLFTTDRGIMMISGATSTCITDNLNSDSLFVPTSLPHLSDAYNLSWLGTMVPAKEYVKEARMVYDYEHQRIIVFNSSYNYALVFSLESNMWGMIKNNFKSPVNSYPEALVMGKDNKLYDLSETIDTGTVDALLVTRPIKLDLPDALKTVDTVLQRGYFRNGHIKTVLYGSRDLFNWHVVGSSSDHRLRGFRGTPYKYFRIALLCNMAKDESLTGATIQYTQRLDNQPR